MDLAVDLAARCIVRRHNQRPLRRAHILAGHLADALPPVPDLMHAALAVEARDRFVHFAPRKLLHGLFERRVFLPDDLIEPGRAHSRLL